MNFFVDFTWAVDVKDVVPVHVMFGNEIKTSKRCDQRTRYAKHDAHAEKQHHSGILFTKPKWYDTCLKM